MLRRLHIENYVLVDSLETTFPEGLVILTGQTGAGKSLLLGALSLLLGTKADASFLSDKDRSCVVEGEFDVPEGIEAIAEQAGFEPDPSGLVIRRVIAASGRSRAFVNDCPVQIGTLQELSGRLIDIHSQHQILRLKDKAFPLEMLDRFAGNNGLLEDCAQAFSRIGRIKGEIASIRERLRMLEQQRDYETARLERLNAASLRQGELEELEAEQKLLANAETVKMSLCRIEEINSPSEGEGLDAGLREVERQLDRTSAYVPSLASLAQRVSSLRVELGDIMDEVGSLNRATDVSESRLAEVEERLGVLYDLMRKYDALSVEDLIAIRDGLEESVEGAGELSFRLKELEKDLSEAESLYGDISSRLRAAREEAAPRFAEDVLMTLRGLELEGAAFSVRISRAEPSRTGTDQVQLMFSATGGELKDLSEAASGGELSRIMLSLKAVMSSRANLPTMVFDEIDTGVSGSAADAMGRLVCSMGDNMQIFAITHLPQVAAKGRAHYLVSKTVGESGEATTHIRRIEGEDRVLEIARMLSGSTITPAAVENAKVLLETKI